MGLVFSSALTIASIGTLAALISTPVLLIGGLVMGAVLLLFIGLQRMIDARTNAVQNRLEQMGITGITPAYSAAGARAGKRRPQPANGQSAYTLQLASELAQADLRITAGEFLTLRGVLASAGALLGLLIPVGCRPLLALVLMLVGLYAPVFWVRRRRNARRKKFDEQLPDMINLMAGALRTGYAFMQTLELVSREGAEPSRSEFARVVREVGLGIPPEEALAHMVDRMQSDDLNLLVTAVNVQREVGGNLVEVLEVIASTIRERLRLIAEVGVLTAQQQLSGYIIAFLPVGLGLLLFIINPTYMTGMFTQTHWCGWTMVTCSGIMIITGLFVIRRIVNIKV